MQAAVFRKRVLQYAKQNGRHDLPWRFPALKIRKDGSLHPYAILVSEFMLQQTQVARVIPKFRAFLRLFPSFRRLAAARPATLLAAWSGLGYNRRALLLHQCAQTIVSEYGGKLPRDGDVLRGLPGIGPYTAAAIAVFAFDVSRPLIETNVRRTYLHHFFPRQRNVSDRALLPLIARDLRAVSSPRAWFAALMDYGTWLGQQGENPNRRSRHYVRQARFEGSVRQLRGRVLRVVLDASCTYTQLKNRIPDRRLPAVLRALCREGFLVRGNGAYQCA